MSQIFCFDLGSEQKQPCLLSTVCHFAVHNTVSANQATSWSQVGLSLVHQRATFTPYHEAIVHIRVTIIIYYVQRAIMYAATLISLLYYGTLFFLGMLVVLIEKIAA